MEFQNWPIRYLKHKYLRIIQILYAITLMCYVFANANVISTTSRVYQIEFFQNSVFFFQIFFRKKVKYMTKKLIKLK
jgi:hypothetical protein